VGWAGVSAGAAVSVGSVVGEGICVSSKLTWVATGSPVGVDGIDRVGRLHPASSKVVMSTTENLLFMAISFSHLSVLFSVCELIISGIIGHRAAL